MTPIYWPVILDESFLGDFSSQLKELPFERLRNQPPPRSGGLPFGFE